MNKSDLSDNLDNQKHPTDSHFSPIRAHNAFPRNKIFVLSRAGMLSVYAVFGRQNSGA